MNCIKALFLGFSLAMVVGQLRATDVYFRDLTATSANGRFRVEAKSPDNADGPWKRSFQSRFEYRLLETGKPGEVWSRRQPVSAVGRYSSEGPPVAIYVSDDGWVVLRTEYTFRGGTCELIVVDTAGQDRLRLNIFGTLFPQGGGTLDIIQVSTAGIFWGQHVCHPYFVALQGTNHFCFTTWWGPRLLLNLPAGRVVTVSPEIEPELVAAESSFVLSTLEGTRLWEYDTNATINPGLAKGSPGPAVHEVITALLMAARLKLVAAELPVRRLASRPVVWTTVGGNSPFEPAPGGVKPAVYQNLAVRQAAQLCLRRLGLQPTRHQTTCLLRGNKYWQPEDPLPFDRVTRASEVKTGLKPEEVLEQIGAPDFISNGWEYDLDGEKPVTLVVRWGKEGVSEVEEVSPPKWRDGLKRDKQLVH